MGDRVGTREEVVHQLEIAAVVRQSESADSTLRAARANNAQRKYFCFKLLFVSIKTAAVLNERMPPSTYIISKCCLPSKFPN